jgi:hypothetical protein
MKLAHPIEISDILFGTRTDNHVNRMKANGNKFASIGIHLFLDGVASNHSDKPFSNFFHAVFLITNTGDLSLQGCGTAWQYGRGRFIPLILAVIIVVAIIQ